MTASVKNRIREKEIAIIGGGPGGLTLARLLQMKGAQVKVYERDLSQASRVQGAIVDLHFDSGLKVIEEANLTDAFKTKYMVGADRYRLLDPAGNILLDDGNQVKKIGFGDPDFRPEIDRGSLRDLLIDALFPDTVVWDSQFKEMREIDGRWQLQFTNGKIATADLAIGADGYRSKVRPYLTSIEAQYSGASIIQGEIDHPETICPEIYRLVDNANLMVMGEGRTLAVQPRGDGGLTFYIASMLPENWKETSGLDFDNREQICTYLVKTHENWNPVFSSLFKTSAHFVFRPLSYYPLDQRWATKGNLTLLGDAAHLMPPNGEGVNLAMLDALNLSECLTSAGYSSLQEAVIAYEDSMIAKAAALCKETVNGIRDFASPTDESIQQMITMLSGQTME
ncbi:FAD-dependent monooxygenase [Mucilaginibacter conchicola]|uniref:Flavin-dependent monooxygenase n=1 Tax=Mucilaginibacter conchicola TaxID=2303333 RepID=A0A372NUF5_9SPHI|nr:NAD(P)/FAD-dependent oxidoreductase [Mucilaginibacter conchicola]RFZ92903.1 FAD-dependent monooxygenase [Mucilaginibacter conchicola]